MMDNVAAAYCLVACAMIYAILSISLYYWRQRHFYKHASKFPGPPTLPIIGNAHLFVGSTEDIMTRMLQLGKTYPAPYRLWVAGYLGIVINTPEQAVLLSPKTLDRGPILDFARSWLGTGLLSAPGEVWRARRKLMQPTFSRTIINSFIDVFSARSVAVAEDIERHLDGPAFDAFKYTFEWALNTICETAIGVKLEKDTHSAGSYATALDEIANSMVRRALSPWLHPNFIFYRTQLGRDQQNYIKFLHNVTNNIIQKKTKEFFERKHQANLAGNEEDCDGDCAPRKKILIDHLIEVNDTSEKLSDEGLREEIDTIMAAATDTTAITTTFVMLMLTSNPNIQEKVYQELCEIYGDDINEGLNVTVEQLTRMKYMERVIKETLRLFPVGPFLLRSSTDDLNTGDYTIPVGSTIVVSVIEIHRNGDYWPDPLKFNPDRFLPEEVAKRDPHTYLPFSGGLRNCIGMRYAMLLMKTLLATILRRYVLKSDNVIPVKDIRLKWEFVMRPVDPITVRIERRTRN